MAKLGEIFPPSYFSVTANIGTVVAVCVFLFLIQRNPAVFIAVKTENRCSGRLNRLSWRLDFDTRAALGVMTASPALWQLSPRVAPTLETLSLDHLAGLPAWP